MKNSNLDFDRKKRRGYQEAVFCEPKTHLQLIEIFQEFLANGQNVIGTRASYQQFKEVRKVLPEIQYNETAKILTLVQTPIEKIGEIAVVTGGTGDIPVAEEASVTAEFFGSRVKKYYDVGISGLHRLLDKIEEIKKANVIIATAGMEGALPSVIAGLVDVHCIALPTSVGYGASLGGISALLTMINSCSEGVSTVNIDNGFNAGYSANQINRQIAGGRI